VRETNKFKIDHHWKINKLLKFVKGFIKEEFCAKENEIKPILSEGGKFDAIYKEV